MHILDMRSTFRNVILNIFMRYFFAVFQDNTTISVVNYLMRTVSTLLPPALLFCVVLLETTAFVFLPKRLKTTFSKNSACSC